MSDHASHSEADSLRASVQTQLESIFSQSNLRQDSYLLSQMNAQRFVSLDILASLASLKQLTEDRSVLVEALNQIPHLVSFNEDHTMVRPINLTVQRTTLILRDIPADTPESEVRLLFSQPPCGSVLRAHPEVGNNWFVVFETEDDCTAAAMHVRSKTFQGKPIQCRVKSENLLRTYVPSGSNTSRPRDETSDAKSTSSSGQNYFSVNGYYPMMVQSYPYAYVEPQFQAYVQQQQASQQPSRPRRSPSAPTGNQQHSQPTTASSASSADHVEASAVPSSHRKHRKDATDGSSSPDSRPKKAGSKKGNMQLGPEHFPALPSTKKAPVASGYETDFRKFSRDEMIAIVEKLHASGSLSRPSSLPDLGSSPAVRALPLTETQLRKPFPVIYPASPSPMLAARAGGNIPSFDLSGPYSPNPRPLPAGGVTDISISFGSLPPAFSLNGNASAFSASFSSTSAASTSFLGSAPSNSSKKPTMATVLAAAQNVPSTSATPASSTASSAASASSSTSSNKSKEKDTSSSNGKTSRSSKKKQPSHNQRKEENSASSSSADSSSQQSATPKRTAASIVAENASKPLQPKPKPASAPAARKEEGSSSASSSNESSASSTKETKEQKEVSKERVSRSGSGKSRRPPREKKEKDSSSNSGQGKKKQYQSQQAASASESASSETSGDKPLTYADRVKRIAANKDSTSSASTPESVPASDSK